MKVVGAEQSYLKGLPLSLPADVEKAPKKVVGPEQFYDLQELPLSLLADVEQALTEAVTARFRVSKELLLLLLAVVGLILIRVEYHQNRFA